METRRYKKYTDTFRDLIALCRRMQNSGSTALPHERELAEELGCSRMTLRKALAEALQQKVLKRSGRFLELNVVRHDISNLGRILFIATGHDEKFNLNALSKLFNSISAEMKKYNGQLELLLTNPATPEDLIRKRCMESDIILFTLFLTEAPGSERLRLFWEIGRQRRVIALSDPYLESFHNFIALDNVAVGMIAAQTLHRAGCRNLGCVCNLRNNMIFEKRMDGFRRYADNSGVNCWLPSQRDAGGKAQFDQAVKYGCDGIFIVSDEGLDVITAEAFAAGVVPRDVKLITVDGCGKARAHVPPVTCVSHGTKQVTSELIKYLIHLSEQPDWPDCRKLITPELHSGATT